MGFFLCYFFSFFLVIFQKSANVTHLSIHREDSNCGLYLMYTQSIRYLEPPLASA